MPDSVVAVLPVMVRQHLDGQLPVWLMPHWFASKEEAFAAAALAQIGWFDMYNKADMAAAIRAATQLRWLNSIFAGIDGLPLQDLQQRRVRVTNGAGINAITIAEYVVLAMLTIAKGYREVVHAQGRHEWLKDSPGKLELYGSKALLLGYGGIGKLVQERLTAFAVDVTVVRRTGDETDRVLGPDQWRARLGEFDWIILAVPATADTRAMIGAAELAAMKRSAVLLNVARGSVVDQPALEQALRDKTIAGAFLDVTDPEPLPPDHSLWEMDNVHISMHLSGRAQSMMFQRSAQRFLENLERYRSGAPLLHEVDLALGY